MYVCMHARQEESSPSLLEMEVSSLVMAGLLLPASQLAGAKCLEEYDGMVYIHNIATRR